MMQWPLGQHGIGGLPHGEALLGTFLKKEKIESHVNVALDHRTISSN